jgi:alpha-tubulin suppressor-like RCC1 family protein
MLSAGGFHTCAVSTAGRTYCWGDNTSGQFGNGGTTPSNTATPTVEPPLSSVRSGRYHTCGLKRDGAALCWGYNYFGQLGEGSTEGRLAPVSVVGGLSFTEASAGNYHTCGIVSGGALYCWGGNAGGRLGTTAAPESCASLVVSCNTQPVAVSGGLLFAEVAAGATHTCGITTRGAAYCWGDNTFGQLGIGRPGDLSAPEAVLGGLVFRTISAGAGHTCGVTEAGEVYCWGSNVWGQLGDGTAPEVGVAGTPILSPTPVRVASMTAFRSVTAGTFHTCAIAVNDEAWCWGDNVFSALGDGDSSVTCVDLPDPYPDRLCRPSPVRVAGGLRWRQVSAGSFHNCGLTTAGEAYCWGRGRDGELGNGLRADSRMPVRVTVEQ